MLYDDDFGTAESAAEVPSTRSPSESIASNAIAEGSGHTSSPPPVFHPLAYRGVVANWPVDWRERWGRRANSLEESGLSWRDAETQAFVEVWNQLRHQPTAEATTDSPVEAAAGPN